MSLTEPFVPRHPWVAALLLGSVATPAGIVLAWAAPRPLDLIVAPPLVLLDMVVHRAGPEAVAGVGVSRSGEALLLAAGIALTWMFYVLAARGAIGRLVRRASAEDLPD